MNPSKYLLAIIVFFCVHKSIAADDPSYAETKQFIVDRTRVSNQYSSETATTWVSFPEKCLMHNNNSLRNDSGRVFHHYREMVKLSELDSQGVSRNASNSGLFARVRGNKKVIMAEFVISDQHDLGITQSHYTGISIHLNSEDDEARVQRALSHLITICGGKKELF